MDAWHTLVTADAPFRSPLRVRVERREDLANMTGELAAIRSEGHNQIGRGWLGIGVGGRKGSRQGHFHFAAVRENPAFRNGPMLIGPRHVSSPAAISGYHLESQPPFSSHSATMTWAVPSLKASALPTKVSTPSRSTLLCPAPTIDNLALSPSKLLLLRLSEALSVEIV